MNHDDRLFGAAKHIHEVVLAIAKGVLHQRRYPPIFEANELASLVLLKFTVTPLPEDFIVSVVKRSETAGWIAHVEGRPQSEPYIYEYVDRTLAEYRRAIGKTQRDRDLASQTGQWNNDEGPLIGEVNMNRAAWIQRTIERANRDPGGDIKSALQVQADRAWFGVCQRTTSRRTRRAINACKSNLPVEHTAIRLGMTKYAVYSAYRDAKSKFQQEIMFLKFEKDIESMRNTFGYIACIKIARSKLKKSEHKLIDAIYGGSDRDMNRFIKSLIKEMGRRQAYRYAFKIRERFLPILQATVADLLADDGTP